MDSVPAKPAASPQQFTVLDWLGTLVAALTIADLMAFPVGSFRTMFQDFGAPDDLPLLTRIVLVPWFTPVLALPAVVSLALGLWPRQAEHHHRPIEHRCIGYHARAA